MSHRETFSGLMALGLQFERGDTIVPIRITDSPTTIGTYAEFWHVTSDGHRTLYADPDGAIEVVERLHEADEFLAATTYWTSADGEITVTVVTGDARLTVTFEIRRTPRTKLASLAATVMPTRVTSTAVGDGLQRLGSKYVLGTGDQPLAGETETGRQFRMVPRAVAFVSDATATVDGTDLGSLRVPPEPVEFGDVVLPARPIYARGALRVEYPEAASGDEKRG
jgi:hypothetical protein